MQNDATASEKLLQSADEENKKKILLFLQRRQEFRGRLPSELVGEAATALAPSDGNSSPSKKLSEYAPETNEEIKGFSLGRVIQRPNDAASQRHHGRDGQCELQTASGAEARSLSGELKLPKSLAAGRLDHHRSPHPVFGVVIVCSSFRYLPSLSDKTKEVASQLFGALTDGHFGRFSRRGSKLLLNPSLIEFQDTMKELKRLCATEHDEAALFMCLASHGARVTSGANEGSYVLFNESRLSSEEELVLTAAHERDLARMIHEIPCKNKLIALELCQVRQAKEKPAEEAPTIVNRIHDKFTSQLYAHLVSLELASERQRSNPRVRTEAELLAPSGGGVFNTLIVDSCRIKDEVPVRNPVDSVSNFLHRVNDAFHGAASKQCLEEEDHDTPSPRAQLQASKVCQYIQHAVQADARHQNEVVKAEYKKQVRTKYEMAAEFEDITHTPQVYGLERLNDFAIGDVPAAPEMAPSSPRFVSATVNSITLSWDGDYLVFQAITSGEVPAILGFHVQIRGDGRACVAWRRASDFQVLGFDEAVRGKVPPPTKVTVHGLASDMAFRFRIRARTAGGWGPFSEPSERMRTRSLVSVHDTFSSVQLAFNSGGVRALVKLMETHRGNRDTQRTCVEFLSRLAIKGAWVSFSLAPANRCHVSISKYLYVIASVDPPRVRANLPLRLTLPHDVPVVPLVVDTVQIFTEDVELCRHASLFIGRLAQSSDAWRRCLVSITEPCRLIDFLDSIASRSHSLHQECSVLARWAVTQLRGVSDRHRVSAETAASRIQRVYHSWKARRHVQVLAGAVYTQLADPSTGQRYFYNSKTGATSWSRPKFL